jgi:hypothetical protein
MGELEEAAAFLDGAEGGGDAPLTNADRVYLLALESLLDLLSAASAKSASERCMYRTVVGDGGTATKILPVRSAGCRDGSRLPHWH